VDKQDVRAQTLSRRAARDATARAEAAEAIAAHLLAEPVVARARRVAAYLSLPSEPGTGPLLDALAARGTEVLLPLSRTDGTLDWVRHEPGAPLLPTALGVPQPSGEPLGPDALRGCDVVLVPALAVDVHGRRLGRGAGYYDRALAAVDVPLCALVFADELLDEVPAEPHDVPVQLVATPAGVHHVLT
jgi:5-formyltetrahydrofolate cyclo-ligase